jgi:hypothetical protein
MNWIPAYTGMTVLIGNLGSNSNANGANLLGFINFDVTQRNSSSSFSDTLNNRSALFPVYFIRRNKDCALRLLTPAY